jgi:hypothetical protein
VNHYKRRGLYADQIEQMLRFFSREQLLILKSEDLFADPEAVYLQVQQFLGLDPHPLPPLARATNVGRSKPVLDDAVLDHLRSFYIPPNQRLKQLLPEFALW